LAGLLAADRDARVRSLVRLEFFGGRFALREVDIGGDGRAQVVAADDGLEQVDDALGQVALDLVHVLQLLRVEAGVLLRAVAAVASFRRTSCTCAAGTRIAVPPSACLYGTFICESWAMIAPPSLSERFAYSTL